MEIKELGHVVLYVSNLERSADFYKNTLGFREIARETNVAAFSSGRTHHELLLIEVGGEPRRKMAEPGLYHIGFKIGETDEELKAAYTSLTEKGVTIVGMSDHHVTHSLYILDPDGNELELYVDINDDWKQNPQSVMSPTRPLQL
jgi:catechol-2,3-dioxygenase